ncbi:MAG: response regulator receiver protein [Planctomycetaceae bacterium]|nr:response regulator receiver protein [Planctomycetaceae bacterium]
MTTILVVDDSGMDRRLAGGLLEKQTDWTIIFAKDGRDALHQIELHVPDIVITDLQMPNLDGLELVEAIRNDYPLIPVILITAKGSEEIAVRALQKGAASYVPKRRMAADLVETVKLVRAASYENQAQKRLMLHRMQTTDCEFLLENDLKLVPSLIAYMQELSGIMGICNEADRLRIGVALEEALINAIYHGNLELSSELREKTARSYYNLAKERSELDPYKDRRVRFVATFTRNEAVFTVHDEGVGFDPGQIPNPTDPAFLDRPCGRGLLLMHTFMDEVRFNESGNAVTLVKRAVRGTGSLDSVESVES